MQLTGENMRIVGMILIALATLVSGIQGQEQMVQDYLVKIGTDPMSGNSSSVALTAATEVLEGNRSMALGMRCTEYGPQIVVVLPNLFLKDYTAVQLRFDGGEIINQVWRGIDTGVIESPNTEDGKVFMDLAKTSTSVRIRVRDWSRRFYTAEFSLMGVSRAVSMLDCFN